MAEETVQYASATDPSSNKRKFEDQLPPPPPVGPRRPTGFSAPVTSQTPPDSSDVPPSYEGAKIPADEFLLAKQRAQEIAARLLNSAEAKRPRVENGGSGFDSGPTDAGMKPSDVAHSSMPVSYGYQGNQPTRKNIEIPNNRVGVIIGKSGETIKSLQLQSGARIQVTRDVDADPNSQFRMVELSGSMDQITRAEQLIQDVLSEAEAGGSGTFSRGATGQQYGSESYVTKIPNNRVGLVIGKGGETIKSMQAKSGAKIQVIPLHLPPGDTSAERTLQIDGSSEQIEAAKQLVNEVIESRNRSTATGGGYSQQSGYQAQPTSWAPPGQTMQPTGYGYMQQTGGYPGQAPPYNMQQTQYPGYPQTTQGGYSTVWDQTNGAPNQQNSQGGGGYNYYGQQQPQQQPSGGSSAPADNTGYGYGYGYGGYPATATQTSYGQTPPNPVQGYDQQQGYGSTPSYGGAQSDTNQAPAPVQSSAMGQQGYMTQQLSPNPASYPPQGSTQPGYGVPTSHPGYGTQPSSGYGPGYGPPPPQKPSPASQSPYGQQPQQLPSAQGGYGQSGYAQPQTSPAQAGYTQPGQSGYAQPQTSPAQAGFAQPGPGGQRAPPPSYGTPPYGGPMVAQTGYGQQQPPPYNSAYGGSYSQPPLGSAEGNMAPTSQTVQPSPAAKASPPSS